MPSSTSSSDDHLHVPARPVPAGSWGKTWLLALVLIVAGVGGMETYVRSRGYEPSVKDDEYSWAIARGRVSDGSKSTVAILGTSRILLAFSTEAFEDAAPDYPVTQLAIDGTQPMGSLIDLAEDPDFAGIAIVDTQEFGTDPVNWHKQDPWIDAYHRRWRTPGAMAERWLATRVQSRLALLETSGMKPILNLWHATPPYVVTHADRTQYADYSRSDVVKQKKRQLDKVGKRADRTRSTEEQAAAWLQKAMEIEPYVDKIQARGGRVVFVRMPTCDERWELDQRQAPKDLYWDHFAAATKAASIHFDDFEELRGFECPDTSHMDSKDAAAFTRGLVTVLKRKGVLR